MNELARAIAESQHGGTPLRLSRSTIVSSLIATSVVQPDGTTDTASQVVVSNFAHTASLAVGTVVEVLFWGTHGYVLGAL